MSRKKIEQIEKGIEQSWVLENHIAFGVTCWCITESYQKRSTKKNLIKKMKKLCDNDRAERRRRRTDWDKRGAIKKFDEIHWIFPHNFIPSRTKIKYQERWSKKRKKFHNPIEENWFSLSLSRSQFILFSDLDWISQVRI